MGKRQLAILHDGPAREHRVAEVAVRAGMERGGVVDVVEPQGARDPLDAVLVHLLQRDHVRSSQLGMVAEQRDDAVGMA